MYKIHVCVLCWSLVEEPEPRKVSVRIRTQDARWSQWAAPERQRHDVRSLVDIVRLCPPKNDSSPARQTLRLHEHDEMHERAVTVPFPSPYMTEAAMRR